MKNLSYEEHLILNIVTGKVKEKLESLEFKLSPRSAKFHWFYVIKSDTGDMMDVRLYFDKIEKHNTPDEKVYYIVEYRIGFPGLGFKYGFLVFSPSEGLLDNDGGWSYGSMDELLKKMKIS